MNWTPQGALLRVSAASLVVTCLTNCGDPSVAQTRQAPPKPEIGAQTLVPRNVTLSAELPGRTSAHLVSDVRPRVSGIVQSRNFEEGSDVKAGDILYQLDPAPFEAAFSNAAATLRRAEGAVPSARARFERNRDLNDRDIVSKQDRDEAETLFIQAEADVAAARAALETARINLEYTKVQAPIDGRIDGSTVTPGALVTADQTSPLATIRQLDIINVDVVRSSANLLRLKKALAAERLKSYGGSVAVSLLLEDGERYPHVGRLMFSESSVSTTAGTVTLRVSFPNPDGLLMPGMFVRAVVEEGEVANSFLVPQRAVSRNARGEPTAKFVTAENRIEERAITVDRNLGNNWLVTGGVSKGDRVVVDGLQKARNGDEVDVVAVQVDERTGEVKAEAGIAADTAQAGANISLNAMR